MVRIPSPSGSERELAEFLVSVAGQLGLTARLDAAGNLVAETGPPDAPLILLLGHLDTVPGQLPVRLADGVLYGRGAVDAKGPLAALLWAAARTPCPHARIRVVGAVGEEGTSPGARHLLRGERPDAVVIGEPSGLDSVVLGYKGVLRCLLEVSRPAAHSSRPEPKAVEVAVEFAHDVLAHLASRASGGRAFERPIATVTSLAGDATRARVELACRTPVGFDGAALRAWLAERAGDDTLTVTEDVPAVRSPRTDPVVAALSESIRRQVRPPRAKVKLGTSDMNVVGPVWSVPIAAYGPGDSRLDHTDEEHLVLADFLKSIDVLSHALHLLAQALGRDAARSAVYAC
ncbi:M20/M25/M40 family metallo-hydrolase [Streptomyces sp. NPDC052396]|uniref:M20/M25/M40 family metallo-hydrolase n=1 Tax=Streptomyces sp. NPDC052396 TaxID=3365689 RepID=UPI0037D18847